MSHNKIVDRSTIDVRKVYYVCRYSFFNAHKITLSLFVPNNSQTRDFIFASKEIVPHKKMKKKFVLNREKLIYFHFSLIYIQCLTAL